MFENTKGAIKNEQYRETGKNQKFLNGKSDT
jgi:hypothetical protein